VARAGPLRDVDLRGRPRGLVQSLLRSDSGAGSPTSLVRRSDSYAWIHWTRQEHFFNDESFRPAVRAATMLKLNSVLRAWGLPRLRQPPRR
jgi:hypothetical protein